jgi:hypothetical protein
MRFDVHGRRATLLQPGCTPRFLLHSAKRMRREVSSMSSMQLLREIDGNREWLEIVECSLNFRSRAVHDGAKPFNPLFVGAEDLAHHRASGGRRRAQRKIAIRSSAPAIIAASARPIAERTGYCRPCRPRRSGISLRASHRVRPPSEPLATAIVTPTNRDCSPFESYSLEKSTKI